MQHCWHPSNGYLSGARKHEAWELTENIQRRYMGNQQRLDRVCWDIGIPAIRELHSEVSVLHDNLE